MKRSNSRELYGKRDELENLHFSFLSLWWNSRVELEDLQF